MAAFALPSLAAALLLTSPALSVPPLVMVEEAPEKPAFCDSNLEEERVVRLLEGMPPSWQPAAAVDDSPSEVWASRCASCHGMNGTAKTFMGRKEGARDFTEQRWQECRTDGDIRAAITRGVAGSKMRAFETHLTDEQLAGLVRLVRGFDARLSSQPVAYAK